MDGQAGKDKVPMVTRVMELGRPHVIATLLGLEEDGREGAFNCGTFVSGNGVQARKEGRRQIHIIAVERLLVIL